ncbi:MAG: DUF6483 family protein [Myxococcota bacterium]
MSVESWMQRQQEAVRSLITQGSQALRQGNTELASAALHEAAVILDMAPDDAHTDTMQLRAQVFNELGVLRQRAGDHEGAQEFHSEAARMCEALLEAGVDFRGNSAATHLNLASVAATTEDFDTATDAAEIARSHVDVLLGAEDPRSAYPMGAATYQTLASLRVQAERFEDAAALMNEALSLTEKAVAADNPSLLAQTAQGCQQLSVLFFNMERFEDALRWGHEAERLSEEAFEKLGEDIVPVYVVSQINLISYNEQMGAFAEAEDSLFKALELVGNDPRLLERGKVLYENLRKQADKRLEQGGLPREEVQESYEEILSRIEEIGGLPNEQA